MKITEVKTYKVESDSKVVALASITLDDCLVIKDLKIMQGSESYFVSMPSRKNQKGEYKDIVFPITKEFRQELQKTVLDHFIGECKKEDVSEYVEIDNTENLPF